MRVGLLIYGNLETISGGFLYDRKLVAYLREHSDPVEVISLPWRSYPASLGDNLSPALYQRLVNLNVDVLLQDELAHPSLFWVNRRVKSRVGYPVVSIVHHLRTSELHPAGWRAFYRLVERAYLRTNDGYIYNSQTTRHVVEALVGKSATRHVVAYPAGQFQPEVQPEEILARAYQSGPLKLLFIGSLIPRKGLHTLLAALESLPPGTATLTVVGGYLADSVFARQMLSRMEATSTQYLGVMPAGQLAGLIRRHHVIAVPSSYEGYGIVYLEGMGFGLPAIATSRGAAGEIITHAQDGYLVPPEDPAALAEAILELANNRPRLAEFSLAARRRYLAHPTWEQSCDSIRRFIQNLATGRIAVV